MEDYFGYGDAYIDGQGYRRKGVRPKAVLDTEFSKSLLDDEDEEGLKKKKGITELQDIDVEEVSYVDVPATRRKFTVIKGDGGVEKSNFKWSENTQRTLLGYSDSDLEEYDYEEEIEKSSNTNPFPSLARIFNSNKEVLEEVYEKYAIGEGVKFLWAKQTDY